MVVYGKKRSKFKMAEMQIFFKAGGWMILMVQANENNFVSAELLHRSNNNDAVLPTMDFRRFDDPEHGKFVRGYVEFMAEDWTKTRERIMRPAEPSHPDTEKQSVG